MTERKTRIRNTTELPISTAIEKLRELATERQAELDEAIEKASVKVYKRFDERSRRIVARVPEELRQHVIDKAGLGGDVETACSNPAPPADDGIPDRLKEPPPPLRPGERMVPRQ